MRRLAEGNHVPAVRELREQLDIGARGVARARRELEESGLFILRHRGREPEAYEPNLVALKCWAGAATPRRSAEAKLQVPSLPPPPQPPRHPHRSSQKQAQSGRPQPAIPNPPGPKDQVREVFRDARIPLPPVLEPEVQGWLDAGLTVSDIEYAVCEAAKSNRRNVRYVSGIIRRLRRERATRLGRHALHIVNGRRG